MFFLNRKIDFFWSYTITNFDIINNIHNILNLIKDGLHIRDKELMNGWMKGYSIYFLCVSRIVFKNYVAWYTLENLANFYTS